MEILRVESLTKTYGRGDALVTALAGVSFSVEKGSFVAVVGASGSGKSTLLHLLGGVDRPTSGNVRIDGQDIFAMNESKLAIFRRRNMGIVYQFYNLIPTLSAEENIMLPYLLDGRRPDEAMLKELLEIIGLSNRAGHLPGELSGGQQQRVSIARALINSPAVILADEPTGNLDSKAGKAVIELLAMANKRYSQTLLLITHDEKIALQADRIITISDGQILRDEGVRQ
ncbi:MAG: ABC transporter ATP-binding protein [Defluviitaleaceae bacterium]|nr:ABC transporter ATP-binding protein [Defluviitaleaceae bacterium]MCL2239801.1 ABC transporter ATP-binding protein [Defluviitaleaceae bacterium]